MNKLTLITLLSILILSATGLAQVNQNNFCAHDYELYNKVKTDVEFKKEVDSIEAIQSQHMANYKLSESTRSGTIYYIPVVYHILHQGGVENISDAQVKSDLKDLNDIYRKRNANISGIHASFAGIAADVEIEFRLAQLKEDGSCFSGITRTFTTATDYSLSSNGGNTAADAVKAVHGDFPGNKYMNIFIAKDINGAAGYTFRPGPPYYSSMRNGIHVLHNYVGTIGTSGQTGFNTTIAHEAGHWLNLAHLWGNSNSPGLTSNCSIDDGLNDTPLTSGWTSCNRNGITCGSLDNVENIMEYSYCSKMFTNNQRTRMRAAITSGIGGRSNVISAANHTATGIFSNTLCAADIESDMTSVCENSPVQFYDNSFHNPTSWSWTFPGGTPSTSNLQNPIVSYSTAGRRTVFLTVSNASGSKSVTKLKYIRVLPWWGASMPYSEGFEITQKQFEDGWATSSVDPSSWGLSNTSFSGSKSAMLRNFNISPGSISDIASRTLNLTGNSSVTISFRYAYARKPSTSGESVQFLISKDCGQNWVIARGLNPTVGATSSEYFPGSSSDWRNTNIVVASSFFSPDFRFMIRVTNGDGNNFFVDDININNVVGVEELEAINNAKLYPNPMTNVSTLELELKKESQVSVSIINILGETVKNIATERTFTSGVSKIEIEKTNLSSGVYFVNLTVNGKSKLKKLVIN